MGQILTHLKEKHLITRSSSAIRIRKKPHFRDTHAKAWMYKDYKKITLGERIQVDHMSAKKNGITVKHFQAWDRKSKFIYAQLYSNATSQSAKKFLEELIAKFPFPIISIQVDGGSEFMGDFEAVCAVLNLELIVLPLASPKKSGGVERGNRIFREEFYARSLLSDSLGALRNELTRALVKYNNLSSSRCSRRINTNGVYSESQSRGCCMSLKVPELMQFVNFY